MPSLLYSIIRRDSKNINKKSDKYISKNNYNINNCYAMGIKQEMWIWDRVHIMV